MRIPSSEWSKVPSGQDRVAGSLNERSREWCRQEYLEHFISAGGIGLETDTPIIKATEKRLLLDPTDQNTWPSEREPAANVFRQKSLSNSIRELYNESACLREPGQERF